MTLFHSRMAVESRGAISDRLRATALAVGLAVPLITASGAAPAPTIVSREHPDFSGIWVPDVTRQLRGPREFLPAAQKLFEKNHKGIEAGDPMADPAFRCLPIGFPRGMLGNRPFWLMQTPTAVGMIGEGPGRPRVIYINGKHVDGLWPQFMGDSTAIWDGDTLVIDTVNMAKETLIANDGTPHSDALHVTERWRLIGDGEMEMQLTVDDPKIFKAPWVITTPAKRDMDVRPQESVCQSTRLRP